LALGHDAAGEEPMPTSRLSEDTWAAMLGASSSLATAVDEQHLIEDLCNNAVLAGHHRLAWFGKRALDGTFRIIPVAAAGEAAAYVEDLTVTWDDSPTGCGPGGTAIKTGKVVTVHDAYSSTPSASGADFAPWKQQAMEFGLRSITAIPVFVFGQIEGILAVYSSRPGVFDEVSDSIHTALSQQAGVGLERLRTAKRLTAAMNGTVAALSATIDARDPYTAGHQDKVSRLSKRIARVMDFTDFEVQGVVVAALLHDIGKIAVPLEVLLKPAALRPEEQLIVQTHSVRGEEILGGIDFPWPVAQVVGQHHERLDGSGYPRNLGSADILPAARIVMVADVFDAMCSDRPYRHRHAMPSARAYIEDHSGTGFDSEVVAALGAIKVDDLYTP
jgi:putative nucleotidyltransferase with HDIG domain